MNAVVLAGGAGIFCAGFDLKEGMDSGGKSFLHRFAEFFQACYLFPKPMVAAVDGPVLGGGAEISMACHARVVGKNLMLGQPEVNLGITPGYGGTQRLPRLVGKGKIRHLGVSVEKAEEGLKAIEYPKVASVQIIYNIFRQRPQDLFFREAQAREVAVIVRVPLASGLLTGKYSDGIPEGSRGALEGYGWLAERMTAMMESCARFIDFESIDVVPMSEYVVKPLGRN